MWNSNLFGSEPCSSEVLSGHHVAGGESGGGSSNELLGTRDALPSPCLWLWLCEGTFCEWWIVGISLGPEFNLASLDGELGSILQEFLGSTAAESLLTERSWCLCTISVWCWVRAVGTAFTSNILGTGWCEWSLKCVSVGNLTG